MGEASPGFYGDGRREQVFPWLLSEGLLCDLESRAT